MIPFLQKIGASFRDHETEFVVWAPLRDSVELVLTTPEETIHVLENDSKGY